MDSALKQQDPEFVRGTFARIAPRYDFANHFLSCGADFLWRAKAAREIASWKPACVLDLATGSGDLAIAIRSACPEAEIIGADFCLPMLEVARAKGAPPLAHADGLSLPFADAQFSAVAVAFGLRNMASWDKAVSEIARVLVRGGRLLVMDFALPRNRWLMAAYRLYLHRVLPRLAGRITRRPEAYEYLGESIEGFPRWEKMADLLRGGGLAAQKTIPLACGIAAIYIAEKQKKNL